MDRYDAQRAIAALHSFRFFGLVFILPGIVGPALPAGFTPFAAYGDFATGVLAMLALLTARICPLFCLSSSPSMSRANRHHRRLLPRHSVRPSAYGRATGQHLCDRDHLVPLLMITHVVAFYFLLRPSVSR
jgi:hypothetical protein